MLGNVLRSLIEWHYYWNGPITEGKLPHATTSLCRNHKGGPKLALSSQKNEDWMDFSVLGHGGARWTNAVCHQDLRYPIGYICVTSIVKRNFKTSLLTGSLDNVVNETFGAIVAFLWVWWYSSVSASKGIWVQENDNKRFKEVRLSFNTRASATLEGHQQCFGPLSAETVVLRVNLLAPRGTLTSWVRALYLCALRNTTYSRAAACCMKQQTAEVTVWAYWCHTVVPFSVVVTLLSKWIVARVGSVCHCMPKVEKLSRYQVWRQAQWMNFQAIAKAAPNWNLMPRKNVAEFCKWFRLSRFPCEVCPLQFSKFPDWDPWKPLCHAEACGGWAFRSCLSFPWEWDTFLWQGLRGPCPLKKSSP